jgi:hypothetical protein
LTPEITSADARGGNVATCVICGKQTEGQKTFVCKRCRKSPLCFEHMDREYKVCSACAAEERLTLYHNLTMQKRNVKSFLRLMQFILTLVVIFYGVKRFVYELVPDFLKVNVFFDYLILWGGVSLAGLVLCYIIQISQRQKIREIEDKIQDHKAYTKYLRR